MKAHELINTPEKWTQGNFALDAYDKRVSSQSPEACRWCVVGAIRRAYEDFEQRIEARGKLALHIPTSDDFTEGIFSWNDDPQRTHAEVHALLVKLDI